MRRFGKRGARRGEIIVMALTAVLVLSALTVTGVYIKNRNEAEKQDGYYIDFDALEAEKDSQMKEAEADDLDYTGTQEEFDYMKQGTEAVQSGAVEKETAENTADANIVQNEVIETLPEEEIVMQTSEETTPVAGNVTTTEPLSFSSEDSLVWPIVGEVLINFSMDKSVYFATLDQYKYSSALVISATEGEKIIAAREAIVTKIYQSNELGNVVEMDLGDGYTLLYGQLSDIAVSEGQYVTTGQWIASAGQPTRYYSAEGCNVYVKLTKDGEAVNPTGFLE